jgi:arginyl-tRNA synthetase
LLSSRVEAVTGIDPELRSATKPQFGHYQSNVALRLANTEGKPPREIAAHVIAKLEVADLCEPPEIAGPGFINSGSGPTAGWPRLSPISSPTPTLVCHRRPTRRRW